jgi:hypothetical protein
VFHEASVSRITEIIGQQNIKLIDRVSPPGFLILGYSERVVFGARYKMQCESLAHFISFNNPFLPQKISTLNKSRIKALSLSDAF